jgi:hypothetical protein
MSLPPLPSLALHEASFDTTKTMCPALSPAALRILSGTLTWPSWRTVLSTMTPPTSCIVYDIYAPNEAVVNPYSD